MSPHVDVVTNNWMAGEQRPVARVTVRDARLQVDSPDRDRWVSVVDRALAQVASEPPERALARLHEIIHGSQLFATTPHEDDECPYRNWEIVQAQPVQAQDLAAAP